MVILAMLVSVALVVCICFLPETKGKPLPDLEEDSDSGNAID